MRASAIFLLYILAIVCLLCGCKASKQTDTQVQRDYSGDWQRLSSQMDSNRQAEQPEAGAHHDLLHLAGQHGQAIPRLRLHYQGGQGRADHRAHPHRDGGLHPGDESDSGQPVPEGGCRAEEGAEGGGAVVVGQAQVEVVVGQAQVEGDGVRAGSSSYNNCGIRVPFSPEMIIFAT